MSNKSPRRRSREFALQALYQWQLAAQSWSSIEKQYQETEGFDKADGPLFKAIVVGVIAEAEPLSVALTPHLDRAWVEVSPIEKAIMLIGAYELTHTVETPYRVIINEAIELAKSFGGTDGHKYVNGVLDKLAALLRGDEVGAPTSAPPKKARTGSSVTVTKKPARKTLVE